MFSQFQHQKNCFNYEYIELNIFLSIVTRHSQMGLSALEEKNASLRANLRALRERRRYLNRLAKQKEKVGTRLLELVHESTHRQQQALLVFQSLLAQNNANLFLLWLAEQWNVLNDCFPISHRGPFGTINELRLGSDAQLLVEMSPDSGTRQNDADQDGTASATQSSTSRWPTTTIIGVPRNRWSEDTSSNPNKVSWNEINASLGHVALLLSILESKPHCSIRFRHKIVPQGSTSKIGIRRGTSGAGTESLALYNLYSDDSFQLFGKRNFNIALQCLLECVLDAAMAIQQRDRTIALPYPIETMATPGASSRSSLNRASSTTELTVGGLSVSYGSAGGIEWTRAMKYLLTNIKHLLIFKPLHLWE